MNRLAFALLRRRLFFSWLSGCSVLKLGVERSRGMLVGLGYPCVEKFWGRSRVRWDRGGQDVCNPRVSNGRIFFPESAGTV